MSNIWRRIVETITVLGFFISFWVSPHGDLKWLMVGATFTALGSILLYEILLTKKDRQLMEADQRTRIALADKDNEIEMLNQHIEKLADPELMSIYKEDERERLRINRESDEHAKKAAQAARDALIRDTQEYDRLAGQWARKQLGLDE